MCSGRRVPAAPLECRLAPIQAAGLEQAELIIEEQMQKRTVAADLTAAIYTVEFPGIHLSFPFAPGVPSWPTSKETNKLDGTTVK